MAFIARVRAASTGWGGGPGLNTFYFVGNSSGTDVDPDADAADLCVERVQAAFAAGLTLYPSSWQVTVSPVVDVLNPVDGELQDSFSVSPPAAQAGSGGSAFGPTPTMLLLQLRTSTFLDGSRVQGRAFIGPIIPTGDNDGTPNSGALGAGVDMGEALQDAGIGPSNPALVVWRRPRVAVPEATPPVTARVGSYGRVTSITVPNKYAVLRSRRD